VLRATKILEALREVLVDRLKVEPRRNAAGQPVRRPRAGLDSTLMNDGTMSGNPNRVGRRRRWTLPGEINQDRVSETENKNMQVRPGCDGP